MDYYANCYNTAYYEYPQSSSFQTLDPRLKHYKGDANKFKEISKNDDELWIETWLSKIGKIDINLDTTAEIKQNDTPKHQIRNTMKISMAKSSLSRSLQVIEKLQQMQDFMKSNVSVMSSIEWKKYTVEIGNLKDELLSLLSHFDNTNLINQLQYKIKQRSKKRLSKKRHKINTRENFSREQMESKRINEAIDTWLERMTESVERVKEEERMKKDADCVLSEVTKKKSEARKHISLINALIKLRSVRQRTQKNRGEKLSSEDERAFANTTEKLIKMWENSLRIYKEEEEKLQLRLEVNAMEDSNATKLAKAKKIEQEWEFALFGPKSSYTNLYWGLTSAERDLETFIAIRKSWDTFLAQQYDDTASKIPIGWILPNLNPNKDWSKYLDN